MHVTVQGIDTFYQSIGRHPTTLLLLPGWGNSWEAWAPLIPQLSRRHRLLIPDLPGFGQSESPDGGWEMARYQQWLAEFLRSQKIDRLTAVLGHSFGGKLATFGWWEDKNTLPLVEKGFFLIDSSGISNELSWSRRLLRRIAQAIPRRLKRGWLAALRRRVYTQLLQETDYFTASRFQEQTLKLILREDIRDRSIQKDWPLHLLWGENDSATPVWMAYEFAKLSTESDVFVIPGVGHFPHQEKPALVLNWLETYGL